MTPERWQRVKEVFEQARLLEPARREAFLAAACAGDEDLRAETESLLSSLEAAGSFIEGPPAGALGPPVEEPLLGLRLGSWRLVGEVGRGGMGAVYRAVRDDQQFQQQAAVKLLPAGADGAAVTARFRSERQILARLDHPNIARLLDGGSTPDGRPYLVMELVEGEWIDRYCDGRGLGVRARLELFATVCEAVQYAHQNLVVHRDIKPGNILVAADGTPKLLDFGIAKLLDPDGAGGVVTVTELRVLTPRYASPEQVRGGPITTSSDVYSLGVLLYELLAGRPPYELRTLAPEELLRVVCRQEPERPSVAMRRTASARATVVPRELEGDLDWIVLKALRKEPERRYASAHDLAEDIRRHLEGLPVHARPDTLGYRASKFARRHRTAVVAAALLLLSLAGGLAASFWQWRRAEAAHREAEQRFDDTRRLAGTLLFEVHDAIESLPGSTKARALIVTRAVEYLDRLAASSVDAEVKAELASGYLRLGDVQGRQGDASLGDATAAVDSYRKAVRLAEAIGSSPRDPSTRRELLAQAYRRLSEGLRATGDRRSADGLLAKAVGILEAVVGAGPGDPTLPDRLAATRFDQGTALVDASDWAGALEAYGRAASLYGELARADPKNARRRRNLALAYKYMGGVSNRLGRDPEARAFYEKAVTIDRDRLAAEPNNATARLDLSFDLASLAKQEAAENHLDAAVLGLRETLALRRSVLDADPVNTQARTAVARVHGDIAALLVRKGDQRAAEEEMRRAVAERETLAAGAKGAIDPPLQLAQALATLGDVLLGEPGRSVPPPAAYRSRRAPEACALYERARRIFGGIRDRLPPEAQAWGATPAERLTRCRLNP